MTTSRRSASTSTRARPGSSSSARTSTRIEDAMKRSRQGREAEPRGRQRAPPSRPTPRRGRRAIAGLRAARGQHTRYAWATIRAIAGHFQWAGSRRSAAARRRARPPGARRSTEGHRRHLGVPEAHGVDREQHEEHPGTGRERPRAGGAGLLAGTDPARSSPTPGGQRPGSPTVRCSPLLIHSSVPLGGDDSTALQTSNQRTRFPA